MADPHHPSQWTPQERQVYLLGKEMRHRAGLTVAYDLAAAKQIGWNPRGWVPGTWEDRKSEARLTSKHCSYLEKLAPTPSVPEMLAIETRRLFNHTITAGWRMVETLVEPHLQRLRVIEDVPQDPERRRLLIQPPVGYCRFYPKILVQPPVRRHLVVSQTLLMSLEDRGVWEVNYIDTLQHRNPGETH